jgi:hypothetical protein
MKQSLAFIVLTTATLGLFSQQSAAQAGNLDNRSKSYFIDVHHFGAGKVTTKDVEAAHQKDLAVEKKYRVTILKYWFDEANGDVYCLSSSDNAESVRKTHAEAHGLLPDEFYKVSEGLEAAMKGKNNLYLDIHELGAGKVTAADVAGAHQKDLAVQGKYGVNLINYWVDEKQGTVLCLAQAPDSIALINTHKEAHGLIPLRVATVKQGQ